MNGRELRVDDLERMLEQVAPIRTAFDEARPFLPERGEAIYYAVTDTVQPGTVIIAEATEATHRFYLFHQQPDADQFAFYADCPLVHLRDAPLKGVDPPPARHPLWFGDWGSGGE